MKNLLSIFTALLFFSVSIVTLSAQNKDSVEGDFEALQALFHSTQGDNLPKLTSVSDLPDVKDATYPFMYLINGDIYWLKFSKEQNRQEWRNAGSPWTDASGWNDMTASTMGDAIGVTVDRNGRVIEIDLQKITTFSVSDKGLLTTGNNLVGKLPAELGNLKKCTKFNVKQNFLYGSLPSEIGSMVSLERLSLGGSHWEIDVDENEWIEPEHIHYNKNNGSDPFSYVVIGKDVTESNRFRSVLPTEWGNLINLEIIELNWQFIQGTLPASWGNLSALKGMFLDKLFTPEENPLYSPIPETWGSLNAIRYFKMGYYNLTPKLYGSLPSGMKEWSNLINLNLIENNLSGEFPALANVSELLYFSIGRNNFTGEFPWNSIFNGKNALLNKFYISNNQFTGEIPDTVPIAEFPLSNSDKYRVADFSLRKNNFSGTFPKWMVNVPSLQIIDISSNNFSGEFPWPELAAQTKIKTIYIDNNNFSGTLPDVDWQSERIRWLLIHNNNFEGIIPDNWESLVLDRDGNYIDVSAGSYDFSGNNLSGRLPDWGKNIDIGYYGFNDNKFTFIDILPVYNVLRNRFGDSFKVKNQKPFGESLVRTMPIGDEVILNKIEFHYEGNVYQWFKDGNPISGANEPILTISNIAESDEGEYLLEVRNSALPDLGTHRSEPIFFEIGADDGLNDDGSSTGEGDGSSSGGEDGKGDGGTESVIFPNSPIQYSPDDDLDNVSINPQISWSTVEEADYYILHMSRSNPSGMVVDVTVEDTTYTHPEILGDNALHHWRVRAVKDGKAGDWSSVREFTTTDDNQTDMPDILGPDHFTENVSVTPKLEWQAVDADRFNIRVINKETSEIVISDETIDPTYTPTDPLNIETAYIWQVKSIKNGMEGAWSPRWEFTTGEYNYVVPAPYLVYPNRNEENDSLTPTFEWESVDADLYIILVTNEKPSAAKVLNDNENDGTVIREEVSETVYTSSVILEPGTTYYWRVKGIKNSEEGEWSETWEFRTPRENTNESVNPGETPLTTELKQNYPNPFNPITQIEFTLAELQNVSISVYNIAGKRVATLVDGVLQAGSHTAVFNASSLSSGIYIYQFVSDSQQFTKKMTLLK